jgi:hypothetical protein
MAAHVSQETQGNYIFLLARLLASRQYESGRFRNGYLDTHCLGFHLVLK